MDGEFNALGEGLKEAKARWMTAKADLKKLEDWLRKEKAACVPVLCIKAYPTPLCPVAPCLSTLCCSGKAKKI